MKLTTLAREDEEEEDDDDVHHLLILILLSPVFILGVASILRSVYLGRWKILGNGRQQRIFTIPPESRTFKPRDPQDGDDEPPEDHWLNDFHQGTWAEKCKAVTRGMQQLSLNEVAVSCIPHQPDWDAGHLMRGKSLVDNRRGKNRDKSRTLRKAPLLHIPRGRLGDKPSGEMSQSDYVERRPGRTFYEIGASTEKDKTEMMTKRNYVDIMSVG